MSIGFLNVVNFLLLCGSPKITIDKLTVVCPFLDQFADHPVFPQCPCVVAKRKVVEIVNEGVADTVVVEIDFTRGL